jgi:hypothetical protein
MARTKRLEGYASVVDNPKQKGGQWCPQAAGVHCSRDGCPEGTFNTCTRYVIQMQDPNNLDSTGQPVLINLKNPPILQHTIEKDKIKTRLICQQRTLSPESKMVITNWILRMDKMKVFDQRCSKEDYDAWTKVRFEVFF